MKLNHVNLPVRDVETARDFFTKYFGLVTVQEVGKNFLAILQDDTGLVLNLSHFDKNSTAEVEYHKDFHIGFFVETREEVDRIYQLISADGIGDEAPERKEGRYGFYIAAPGGFVVEVACMEWPKMATPKE
ncbi:VOC family protein [Armatimonas sp.]|uniref:VOC family protein n=1 Tax=Armatimonas sp. TaxID=1872638 RepID=UPI00286D3773|nr:VOC family protein [Armatimonas sp.]